LREIDPSTAARLAPADTRRVIRALEVAAVTGRPLSEHQREQPLPETDRPPVFWLSPDRAWLHQRINRRVEQMIADGLLDEVRTLVGRPQGMSHTARQGLGYKEVIAHLEGGIELPSTVNEIQTRTRQFAKRQHTWFRNLVECQPVDIGTSPDVERMADEIVARGRNQRP
jgi:tRNA dimethylallyltransferase